MNIRPSIVWMCLAFVCLIAQMVLLTAGVTNPWLPTASLICAVCAALQDRFDQLKLTTVASALSAVHLGPGDIIVLSTDRVLDEQQRCALRHAAESAFGNRTCVVLDGDVRMSVAKEDAHVSVD